MVILNSSSVLELISQLILSHSVVTKVFLQAKIKINISLFTLIGIKYKYVNNYRSVIYNTRGFHHLLVKARQKHLL